MSNDNTTVGDDAAIALAQQARSLDEGKRQTAQVTQYGDKVGIDWANIAPPGVDPHQYVVDMVAKAGPVDTAPVHRSDRITETLAPPATLVVRPKDGGTPIAPNTAGPTDIVEVNLGGGKTTSITCAMAAEMGLIKQDRDGGYRPVSDGERGAAQDAANKEDQDKAGQRAAELDALRASGDEPDHAANAAIEAVVAQVPSHAMTAMVQDYIENQSLSLAQVSQIAKQSGMPAERASALATATVEGLRRQADKAMVSSGVPAGQIEEAYAWMAQRYPREHKAAARSLILASKAAALKDLAAKYLASKRGQ